MPANAQAQCTPDPTVTNGTTTCTGVDANGIRVTTNGTTLVVASGATVTNTSAPAIAVDVPASTSPYYNRSAVLGIAGTVDGGTQVGISLLSGSTGSGTYDVYGLRSIITVSAGARVAGASGIVVGASAGNTYGGAIALLDNSGSITGTGGFALLSTAPLVGGFASIVNRAGGTIGAINAPVGTLTNAGTINGGANSAINTGTTYNSNVGAGAWSNSGTIQSAGTGATIANASYTSFTNTGTLSNAGTGLAITGGTLVNAGRIATGGTTAISGTNVTLTNTGRIDGSVVTTAQNYGTPSVIDSSKGIINGNVSLGAANDVLVARYDGTPVPVTGVTGTIDGGGGTDTLRLVFDANTTVAAAVRLPTNFEQLGLAPSAGVTATLGAGFANTGTVVLGGNGTVVNGGTLTGSGTVVTIDNPISLYPSFVNQGTIRGTSTTTGQYAVALGYGTNGFSNSGTVRAITDAVFLSTGSFTNSGTITAGGTAVSASSSTLFGNAGTIQSTAGTALVLSGGSYNTNSGRIDGAKVGVNLAAILVNTGTITSAGTGVLLQWYGQLDNRAGATIAGTTAAIASASPGSLYAATVRNAGTINGNVNLNGSNGDTYNADRFFALPGGVLNGNLTMGAGGYFITQLVNPGPGSFAGVTGTVTGNGAGLVYQTGSDATATFAPVAGFASIGYELFNGAKVTLTGSGTSATKVTFAGIGSADLAANLTATTAPAISITSLQPTGGSSTGNMLSITSRGALTLTRTDANSYPGAAVANDSTTRFTNAGTISVRDQAPTYNRIAAIANGIVTNTGTIGVGGAIGVSGATSLTNSGTIVQLAGASAGIGVENVGTLVNTGTISVGGVAVDSTPYFYTLMTIANAAGATIAGGAGTAIRLASATLTNAGTITGTVDLGYAAPVYTGAAPTRSGASSIYVANGGTIAGDLLFGAGSDLFLQTGDTTGVSGVVDGGAGNDVYGRVLSTTGSAAIDPPTVRNFEDALIQAKGADTVATATATGTFGGSLYALGNGSVVNMANLAGSLTTSVPYPFATLFPADQNALASLTNAGTIGGTVNATVPVFTNTGAIGSNQQFGAVATIGSAAALTFTNTGTILSAPAPTPANYYPYYSYYDPHTVTLSSGAAMTITNGGRIAGSGLTATAQAVGGEAGSLSLTNSGAIAGTGDQAAVRLQIAATQADAGGAITVANSGTIAAQGSTDNGNSGSAVAMSLDLRRLDAASTFAVANMGSISATSLPAGDGSSPVAVALQVRGTGASGTLANAAGAVIAASGTGTAYAVVARGVTLNLVNAGTISAAGTTSGTAISASDATTVRNTGAIRGDIRLGASASTIDNAGVITGAVTFGAGNDLFVQRVGSSVSGMIDGGDGSDSYLVDTTGGTATLAASTIVNFERVTQIGTGTGSYSGGFGVDTIHLAGGSLSVAAGQTLATTGAITVTGDAGSNGMSIVNAGIIAGGIRFAANGATVVNTGTIGGSVQFGAGDDVFVEGVGSRVAGGVDGGGGTNLYRVVLAGDRSGIGARTNFQNLAVDGAGTLALALDQNFQSIALGGTNLALTMGGYAVDQLRTSDASTRLTLDGRVGSVQLGAGADTLILTTGAQIGGTLDGGAGSDTLVLDGSGGSSLGAGQVVRFESGIKQGSGTWTLAGGGTASFGTVAVNAGTLNLASAQALANTTNVAIAGGATLGLMADQAVDTLVGTGNVALGANRLSVGAANGSATFGGSLAGSGGLTKMGSGTLNLTGVNAYGGATLVNGGRLAVNGSIAAPVTVNAGGTLGGNGTVGSTIVAAGGTLAPGNSIGTLNVAGNVGFAAGSVYQVEADASGAADRINATGTATLAGGTVQVLAASGTYAPLTNYTILTAAGGVTGRFAGATTNLAFLTPFLTYGPNAVTLELGRNDIAFASQATSANGVAVANAVAARGLGDPLYNAILVQTAYGAGNAFNRLSGEIHPTISTAMIDSDRRVRDAIAERARAAQGDGLGLWLQSMNTYAESQDQPTAFGFHTSRMGVYGGIDYAFGGFRIGVSGGYFDDKLRVPGLASRAAIETDLIGGSISYATPGGRLQAIAGATHGWHHIDTTRTVNTPGLSGSYIAAYASKTTQAFGELGYDLLRGPVALTPFVRYDYDWLRGDGFDETGGLAALRVAGERRHNAFGTAGARIAASYPVGRGLLIEPHASAAYLRTWDRTASARLASFGGTGPGFLIVGDRLGRDNIDADAGIDLVASTHIRIGFGGYVTHSKEWQDYGGKGSVGIRF